MNEELTPEPDARERAEEIEETLQRWSAIARAFNDERRATAEVTKMHSSDKNDMDDVQPEDCPYIALDEEKGITWTAKDRYDDTVHMFLPWDVLDGTTSMDDWIDAWVRDSYEKLQQQERKMHEREEARRRAEYERLKAHFEGYEGKR